MTVFSGENGNVYFEITDQPTVLEFNVDGFGQNFWDYAAFSVSIGEAPPPDHPEYGLVEYIAVETLASYNFFPTVFGEDENFSLNNRFFVDLEPDQVLIVSASGAAVDGGVDWFYSFSVDGLSTSPLRFISTEADSIIHPNENDPFVAYNQSRVHIYHEAANEGISVESGMIIEYALSRFSVPNFVVDHYDADTDVTRPMFFITSGDTAGKSFLFGNLFLTTDEFEMIEPLMLRGFEVTANDFILDHSGVRFGFISNTEEILGSDALGSLDFGSSVTSDEYGLLDFDGNLIGPARWTVRPTEDVSLLGGAFVGNVVDAVLRIVPDSTELQLVGTFAFSSFIGLAEQPIIFTILESDRGIWADEFEGNFDGVMRSESGTTIIIDSFEGGYTVDLSLSDLGFDLGDGESTEDYFYVNNVGMSLGQNGRHVLNLNGVTSTAWSLQSNPDNAIELNSFTVQSGIGSGDDEFREFSTPLAGVKLDYVSLAVTDLMESVETPTGIAGLFAFDWRGGGGETLVDLDLTGTLTSSGIFGNSLVSMGVNDEFFTGGGPAVLSIEEEALIARVAGTFHLTLIGDIAVTDLELVQRYGPAGRLKGEAEATFDLPYSLKVLFGQIAPVTADIDVAIHSTAYRSLIDANVTFDSQQYDGEIGFRERFEGEFEVLGGVLLDFLNPPAARSAGPQTFALMAAEESQEFDIPATDVLLMGAIGDIDEAGLRVTGPGGTEYLPEDFAARGISVHEQAGGTTVRVNNAEAGVWTLFAPGATDFVGFADTPDPELSVEYIDGVNGPILRFTITGPDQLYDLDILAGAAGDASPPVVLGYEGFAPGTYDIPLDELGLPPGSYSFGGAVSGEEVLSAEALLPTPVAITGAPDLAISVAIKANPLPESPDDAYYPGEILIRVINNGTAVAFPGDITTSVEGLAPLQGVGRLEAGESFYITLPLGDVGFDVALPFAIDVSIAPTAYDANEANHSASASYDPATGSQTLFFGESGILLEDGSLTEHLGGSFTIAAQPAHGMLEAIEGGELRYTPAPDFYGVDIGTIVLGGVETQVWYLVQPVNDAPVLAMLPGEMEVQEGDTLSLAIKASDVDAYNQLTISATLSDGSPLPDWLTVDPLTGVLAGTPPVGASGLLNLTITASDGDGESDSADLAIRVEAETVGITVIGTSKADVLAGSDGNDLIQALSGNDSLDGGLGADTMEGGLGNDTYHVDNALDNVVEGENGGTDTVHARINHTLAAHVEKLVLVGDGLRGTGNDLANQITGTNGADVLDGGAGADSLKGGLGDDTYLITDLLDSISDSGGLDRAETALATYTLAGSLEDLAYTGTGSFSGTGNKKANVITGGQLGDTLRGEGGNDTLEGKGGADFMYGGKGNDTYAIDDDSDVLVELIGEGTDLALVGIAEWTLADNIENATVSYAGDTILIGNALKNTLTGGMGDDVLHGGIGADILYGGAGNDRFAFAAAAESSKAGGIDTIADFAPDDRIDLAGLDANSALEGLQAFTFIGSAGFTGVAGQLRYGIANGITTISADLDGDRKVDFTIKLNGEIVLSESDFILLA